MKKVKYLMALILLTVSIAVMAKGDTTTNPATITPIAGLPVGGTTFALYTIDAKKVPSKPAAIAALTNQLSPYGVTPCIVTTDINATPIDCGAGLVHFGTNELYSYHSPINIRPIQVGLNRGVNQVFAANFRSPQGTVAGDYIGGAVHIHFSKLVYQFSMRIDSGQSITPSVGSVQFFTGTTSQTTPIEQPLVPGTVQWVGVQDPNGFTDVIVVPSGGATSAFASDMFSIVTTPIQP